MALKCLVGIWENMDFHLIPKSPKVGEKVEKKYDRSLLTIKSVYIEYVGLAVYYMIHVLIYST